MMWFWAYRRLRKGLDAPSDVSSTPDWAKLEALASGLTRPVWVKGDGLFSRLRNWLYRQKDEVEFIKLNWDGDDESLTAFLLGLEVALHYAAEEADFLEVTSRLEKRG